MNSKQKDFFAEKAKDYDTEKTRVDNVTNIAKLILKEISYQKDSSILDFGSGTGLLLSKIAPYVENITAVDISKAMNKVLKDKKHTIACNLDIIEMDLTKENLNLKFNGIISSMTMHHVKDVVQVFKKFYNLLHENGTIAIADLDKEDGTFHTIDTGVFHHGFDRDEFITIAKGVGFKNLKIQTVGFAEKPYGKYPVFLLTGTK